MSLSPSVADDHAQTVPRFVIAMSHPTMRRYVCDLIEQHCRCWLATTSPEAGAMLSTVAALRPDALIVEATTFSQTRPEMAGTTAHVLVIGPSPDSAYREAALHAGADAWVARDRLSTDLVPALQHIRCDPGCTCGCHDHPRLEEAAS